jgi:hypothetical protein
MTSTPVTSYSDLQRYTNCPRSWYLGTYLRLKRKAEPLDGPLPFGSRIHTALERWGRGEVEKPEDAYDALMKADFDRANELGLFTDGLVKEAELGHIMLEGFPDWLEEYGFDEKYEVLSVEAKLSETLMVPVGLDQEPVGVLLRGKLDQRLRRRSDKAVLVNDFKTTSSLSPDTIGNFDQTPQLRLYLLLERQQAPADQWSAGYVITLLRKVKRTKTANPPFYGIIERNVSEANLRAAAMNIRAQVTDLVATKSMLDANAIKPELIVPFHVSWQCKSCPFRNPCFEMQDGNWSGAKNMLENEYEVGDPFARYADDDDATKLAF